MPRPIHICRPKKGPYKSSMTSRVPSLGQCQKFLSQRFSSKTLGLRATIISILVSLGCLVIGTYCQNTDVSGQYVHPKLILSLYQVLFLTLFIGPLCTQYSGGHPQPLYGGGGGYERHKLSKLEIISIFLKPPDVSPILELKAPSYINLKDSGGMF
jgi:hypothetical protein